MRQKWIIGVAAMAFWLFAAQLVFTAGITPALEAADASVAAPTLEAKTNEDGSVTLTWSATEAPRGFTIQSADLISGVNTYTAGASDRSFTTGQLPKSNTYNFRVRQDNATGYSAWSPIKTVTIP